MKKRLTQGLAVAMLFTMASGVAVRAETNGYGQGDGRTDTVNVNDYSTSVWDRFIYNYEFDSGADYSELLGRPTGTDIVPRDTSIENVQWNKDAAFNPPSYGVFSGDIDTERSNPYFSAQNYDTSRNTTDYSMNASTGTLPSTSLLSNNSTSAATTTGSNSIPVETIYYTTPKVTTAPNVLNTEALYYADGSIGTISIPRFNAKVKVYEGETLSNLSKGLGHFSFTSAYDGNVGICGHNDQEFKNLKNLKAGDEIIYETKYGTRTYVMSTRTIINDTDYSTLRYSTENTLTLITCVNGVPSERYSVLAVEKK